MLLRLIDAFKVLEVIPGADRRWPRACRPRSSRCASPGRRANFPRTGRGGRRCSNYLLILLMVLTLGMFAFTPAGRRPRARRLRLYRRGGEAEPWPHATPHIDRQNPAFYALIAVLIFMSGGEFSFGGVPILLLLANSLKSSTWISPSGTGGLLFMPTIRNYETALCDILWYEPGTCGSGQIRFRRGLHPIRLSSRLVSTALTLIMGTVAAYALVALPLHGGADSLSLSTLAVRIDPPRRGCWCRSSGLLEQRVLPRQ